MPAQCTDATITTITQAGLAVGQAVYLTASLTYAPAIATSLASSQVVGFITASVGTNMWTLQTSGYNVGAITVDQAGNPLVPATVYYLSTTIAGAISATNPTAPNTWSKPIYISEQIAGVGTVNAGYILNQRPLEYASIVSYDQAFAMALLFGR